MTKNEGKNDRLLRTILGIVILYFAYTAFSGILAIIGYVVSVALLFSAATGYCCLYRLFGINTNKQ